MQVPKPVKFILLAGIILSYAVLLLADLVLGGLWIYQHRKLTSARAEVLTFESDVAGLNEEIAALSARKLELEEEITAQIDPEVVPYLDTISVMEGIRELNSSQMIQVKTMTPNELSTFLEEEFNEEYTDEELATDERCLKAIGLLPANADLKSIILDTYSSNILGFYETEEDTMYIIDQTRGGETAPDVYYQYVFAHEYVHFLQDMTWDLDKMQDVLDEEHPDNSDLSLAFTSLIEGDAVTAEDEFLLHLKRTDRDAFDELADYAIEQSASVDYSELPAYIREYMLFPYTQGSVFVSDVVDAGGWAGVDAMYNDIPKSSEQILHPEKYTEERDDPVSISPADKSAQLGEGWSYVDQDVMGELLTKVVFDEAGVSTAEGAARGWDGDLLQFYENSSGELFCIWQTYWDTEEDADEFLEAFSDYAEYYSYSYTTKTSADGKVTAVFSNTAISSGILQAF